MAGASKAFLRDLAESRSEWKKIKRPCDLCARQAIWEHPAGGLRCGKCPRPETLTKGSAR